MAEMRAQAAAYAQQYGISGGWAADAFTHAYGSAVMSREWGPRTAELLGNASESLSIVARGPAEAPAARMDIWNNAVGRNIQVSMTVLNADSRA